MSSNVGNSKTLDLTRVIKSYKLWRRRGPRRGEEKTPAIGNRKWEPLHPSELLPPLGVGSMCLGKIKTILISIVGPGVMYYEKWMRALIDTTYNFVQWSFSFFSFYWRRGGRPPLWPKVMTIKGSTLHPRAWMACKRGASLSNFDWIRILGKRSWQEMYLMYWIHKVGVG